MFKRLILSSRSLWEQGAIVLRGVAGLIMFKYGLEIFSAGAMSGYISWMTDLNIPNPKTMATIGKIVELVGGGLLIVGLFTRVASISLMLTMAFIFFIMGEPEFLAADGSFLLMLIFLHFFISGPGSLSLDNYLFEKER